MYTSPELAAATDKLITHAKKNKRVLGLFLFGTDRVEEFLKKDFAFISIGNDLHHVLTALLLCFQHHAYFSAPTPPNRNLVSSPGQSVPVPQLQYRVADMPI